MGVKLDCDLYKQIMSLKNLIKNEPNLGRWLIHLYQQLQNNRVSVIAGAGISAEAGVPLWGKLVGQIVENISSVSEETQAHFTQNLNPTYLTQVGYSKHVNSNHTFEQSKEEFYRGESSWARLVHKELYKSCPDTTDEILKVHPYLEQFAKFCFKCPLVITFNFDDLLSEAMNSISGKIRSTGGDSVPPDVIWKPRAIEKQNATTIFHINGYLPRVARKKRSEKLIFTENSFADALISANTPEFYRTLSHLSNHTNLIIGHSLEDASLKNLLRSLRNRNPSQLNYMFHWMTAPDQLSDDVRKDLFDVNLEVYNLITIFVTSENIAQIFEILNQDSITNFKHELSEIGVTKTKFPNYVVSPVAGGKTSAIEHLRHFETYEEWLEPGPPELYKSHTSLNEKERSTINSWVVGQLSKKNTLLKDAKLGFFFMDRGPLDALVFSKDKEERKEKAIDLLEKFQGDNRLEEAQVFFVSASGEELVSRNLRRGRLPEDGGDKDYLDKQSKDLKSLYQPVDNCVVNSEYILPGEVARKIATHCLLGPYSPINLDSILRDEVK